MKTIGKSVLTFICAILLCLAGILCVGIGLNSTTQAEAATALTLNGVFGDNMVLQRGKSVKIWGRGGTVGNDVIVTFGGQTKTAKITSDGWQVYLDPMTANATGQTLTVTSGSETLTVNSVVVDEVLFCSGQSNIAISVSYIANKNDNVFDEYATYNNFKNIRIYTPTWTNSATKETIYDAPHSKWLAPKRINGVINCSAFAAGLALNVQAKIGGDVPVGVIETSTGGSCIEQWLSEENDKKVKSHASIHAYSAATYYNGMVASLRGMTMNGVFWYQGECCVDFADDYANMLAVLVDQYRTDFEDANLPIYVMQLPQLNVMVAYGRKECENGWVGIRKAQQQIEKMRTNVHTVCIIDTGDATDSTDCIHPADKWNVTERAAGAFVKETLGLKYSDLAVTGSYGLSPTITSATLKNNKLEITFSEAVTTTEETIQGFTAKDASGTKIQLDYTADGNKITAETSENITKLDYLQDVSFGFDVLKNQYGVPLMPACDFAVTALESDKFTVTLMDGDNTLSTKTLVYGDTVENFKPTKSGYTFEGWYTDKALTIEFPSTEGVTENVTLYAKFEVEQADKGGDKTDNSTDKGGDKTDKDSTDKGGDKTDGIGTDKEKSSGCGGAAEAMSLITLLGAVVVALKLKF